jgi:quercetin dioxygenase-like cupin family protein
VTPIVQVDDGRVRVTRWTLRRGDDTGRHRHEHDYVVVPLVDARMTVVATDGSRTTHELRSGVSYARSAGVEHTVGNEHDDPLDFVEVEIIGLSGAAVGEGGP